MDCNLISNKENSNLKKKLSPLAKLLGITEEKREIKDTKTKASSDSSDDDEKLNSQNPKIYDTEINFNKNQSLDNEILSNNNSNSTFNDEFNINSNQQNCLSFNEQLYQFYHNYKNNKENLQKISPIYYYYYGIDHIFKKEIKNSIEKNNKNFIEKKVYYNNYKNNYFYYIPYQVYKNNSLNGISDKELNNNKNCLNKNNTNIQIKQNIMNNNNEKNKHKKSKPFVGRNGDWICRICRNLNFAFRIICNRCHISKIESEKIIFVQYEKQNMFFSNLYQKQKTINLKNEK